MIQSILVHLLSAFYKVFWISLLVSFLISILYIVRTKLDMKELMTEWWHYLKSSSRFRKVLLFLLFSMMVACITVLDREICPNPLSDVLGGWGYEPEVPSAPSLALENVFMLMPSIYLFLDLVEERIYKKFTLKNVVCAALKVSFLLSLSIELLQLFLKVGLFQISDLAYNTLGGILSGMLYYFIIQIKKKIHS